MARGGGGGGGGVLRGAGNVPYTEPEYILSVIRSLVLFMILLKQILFIPLAFLLFMFICSSYNDGVKCWSYGAGLPIFI